MRSIEEIRRDIDRIDQQIAPLLTERLALAREIGQLKKAYSMPVRDEKREEEILAALPEDIRDIYRSVFAASVAVEEKE